MLTLPSVSLISRQYLCLRTCAAALGCLCLVRTPFLLPTTRFTPAKRKQLQISDIVSSYMLLAVCLCPPFSLSIFIYSCISLMCFMCCLCLPFSLHFFTLNHSLLLPPSLPPSLPRSLPRSLPPTLPPSFPPSLPPYEVTTLNRQLSLLQSKLNLQLEYINSFEATSEK